MGTTINAEHIHKITNKQMHNDNFFDLMTLMHNLWKSMQQSSSEVVELALCLNEVI